MPSLAPAPPTLSPSALPDTNKPIVDKLNQGVADTKTQMGQIEQNREGTISRLEGERDKLMPPQLQSVPAPVTKATSPMHIWGSAAITLALLGSLMTRQPLMTAMNAAAGVLNAYRQGDQAAANAAFNTWKVSSENAMKLYDYQTKVYEKVLGDIDRREHEADTEASHQETAIIAELRANGAAFNDQLVANVRTVAEFDRLQTARDNHALRMEEAAGKLEEMHSANEALSELRQSPEYKGADQQHRFVMEMGILKYRAPSQYDTGVKQANAQAKQMATSLNNRRQMIKDRMDAFMKEHAGVVPSDKAGQQQWAQLTLALRTVDASREKMAKSFAERDQTVPLDQDTIDSLMNGGSTHKPPPFPPSHEGQAKIGPDGTMWVVVSGKWQISPSQSK